MQVYLKATQVDGGYNSDPTKDPAARRYSHVSFRKCVLDGLKVRPQFQLVASSSPKRGTCFRTRASTTHVSRAARKAEASTDNE